MWLLGTNWWNRGSVQTNTHLVPSNLSCRVIWSHQNCGKSLPTRLSPLPLTGSRLQPFPSPSIRFLGKLQFLIVKGRGTDVSIEYLHSCKDRVIHRTWLGLSIFVCWYPEESRNESVQRLEIRKSEGKGTASRGTCPTVQYTVLKLPVPPLGLLTSGLPYHTWPLNKEPQSPSKATICVFEALNCMSEFWEAGGTETDTNQAVEYRDRFPMPRSPVWVE